MFRGGRVQYEAIRSSTSELPLNMCIQTENRRLDGFLLLRAALELNQH